MQRVLLDGIITILGKYSVIVRGIALQNCRSWAVSSSLQAGSHHMVFIL